MIKCLIGIAVIVTAFGPPRWLQPPDLAIRSRRGTDLR